MTGRAPDEDVEQLLEPLLRDMLRIVGWQAVLAIVQAYGGTRLYIAQRAHQNEELVALIGAEKAELLGREMGGERPLIPKARRALEELRNRQILAQLETDSVRNVCRRFGLAERQVWKIKRLRSGGPRSSEPGLFD